MCTKHVQIAQMRVRSSRKDTNLAHHSPGAVHRATPRDGVAGG